MIIGGKQFAEVTVTDNEGNLILSITDENVINHDSVKVELVKK